MSQTEPNGGEGAQLLTHFQLMQKVRGKMNELYVAFDAFKSDLISDSADLINQQLRVFGKMVEERDAANAAPKNALQPAEHN